MSIKNSVFGSGSERKLFEFLESRWAGKQYRLAHGLHLSNILERTQEQLGHNDWNLYLKSEVDYTLCDRSTGRPILSIEFDGLGGGHGRGDRYIKYKETPDPYRSQKLDFKIKLAQEDAYPFFIVSYPEGEAIDQNLSLLVIDGLIGQALAHADAIKAAREKVVAEQTTLSEMPANQAVRRVNELFDGVSLKAEWDNNPIAKEASKQFSEALLSGIFPDSWYTKTSISSDKLQELRATLAERVKSFDDCVVIYDPRNPMKVLEIPEEQYEELYPRLLRVGTKIKVETSMRVIEKTVWVRNIFLAEARPETITQAAASAIQLPRRTGEAPTFVYPRSLIDPRRLSHYIAQLLVFRALNMRPPSN